MDDSEKHRLMREKRRTTVAAMFASKPDLLWLFRSFAMTRHSLNDMRSAMFDLDVLLHDVVWDELWNSENHKNKTALNSLIGHVATYLSMPDVSCNFLRQFFLSKIIMRVQFYNKPEEWSNWAYLLSYAFLFGAAYFFGWWIIVVGIVIIAFPLYKKLHWLHTASFFDSVVNEVMSGAFDDDVTIERLKALESRGVWIPSVVYSLLKQPRIDIRQSCADKWQKLSEDRYAEIQEIHKKWLAEIEGTPEEPEHNDNRSTQSCELASPHPIPSN